MKFRRLKAIAEMVKHHSIVADIGTDHGILPIFLYNQGISKRIIAVDISYKSLSKLVAKLEKHPEIDSIEYRRSDGLEKILPFEADTVVISGMGGLLITNILDRSISIAKSANFLILQPNNGWEHLRKYLHNHGFLIFQEADVIEQSKYYPIIMAKVGKQIYQKDYEYKFGKELIKNRSDNLRRYIHLENSKWMGIREQIMLTNDGAERITEIQAILDELSEVQRELEGQ